MQIFRPLQPIKALTFDLDDTLYDNTECMRQAEQALLNCLRQIPTLHTLVPAQFNQIRQQIFEQQPEICHDVIVWRQTAIAAVLQQAQLEPAQIAPLVAQAMQEFTEWRHKITVPQTSLDLLAKLSQHYPLAVITNGNVEIARLGLDRYFQFALRGGEHGRAKPFPEIFLTAAERLQVAPEQILHVGDNLITDVKGAIESGLQACWLNLNPADQTQLTAETILPTVAITDLSELLQLL